MMQLWQEILFKTCQEDLIKIPNLTFSNAIQNCYSTVLPHIEEAMINYVKKELGKSLAKAPVNLRCAEDINGRSLLSNEVKQSKLYQSVLSNYNSISHLLQRTQFKNGGNEESAAIPKIDENRHFPSASKLLRVVKHKKMGRHVIASDDIDRGGVLFVEKPVAFAILGNITNEYCHSCCTILKNIVPCDYCDVVAYCSEQCKIENWRYLHSIECRYLTFLQSLGIAYLALRCITSVGSYQHLLKELERIKDRKNDHPNIIITRGYEALSDLTYHPYLLDRPALSSFATVAVLLTTYLHRRTNYFPENVNQKQCQMISELILKHSLQLMSNAHTIVSIKHIPSSDNCFNYPVKQEMIASAIYPSASIMNHSCRSNISNSFLGTTLVVRANKNIAAGDGVYNSYGPLANIMPKHERQSFLQEQFAFECQCISCVLHYDEMDIVEAFKCASCMGPLLIPKQDSTFACNCCNTVCKVNKLNVVHIYIMEIITQYELNQSNFSNLDTLQKLLKGWRLARKYLFSFNTNLIKLTRILAAHLVTLRNFKLSALLLATALKPASFCYLHKTQEQMSIYLELSTAAEAALLQELTPEDNIYRKIAEINRDAKEEIRLLKLINYSFIKKSTNSTIE